MPDRENCRVRVVKDFKNTRLGKSPRSRGTGHPGCFLPKRHGVFLSDRATAKMAVIRSRYWPRVSSSFLRLALVAATNDRAWVRSSRFDARTRRARVRFACFGDDVSACCSAKSPDAAESSPAWVRSSCFDIRAARLSPLQPRPSLDRLAHPERRREAPIS
jgi:hypothetical protein